MTTRDDVAIPYESQPEGPSNRRCGAAALSMVYRSLASSRAADGSGAPGAATQDEIWEQISKPGVSGVPSCFTHLMVKDALRRGYAAVAIQAERPLLALQACRANGIRAILNHRLRPDGAAGHYTVLVGMDGSGVIVHDPLAGPSQRVPFDRLLELWEPGPSGSEVIGNVLIGIADRPPRLETCPACSTPIPAERPCPKCQTPVPLAPSALVGCVAERCPRRTWRRVCCPSCDFTFPFGAEPGPAVPTLGPGLWNLGTVFAELDRFQGFIRSLPEVAGREEVQQLLTSLEEKKEQLRLAEHEELARKKVEDAKAAERAAAIQKERERVLAEREAATTPAAPLDGDALTAQLLKDLGLAE